MEPDMTRRTLMRRFGVLGGAAAVTTSVSACGGQLAGGSDSNDKGAKGEPVGAKPRSGNGDYVEVLALTSLPYFIDHKKGMDVASDYLGVKTGFLGPSDLDIDQMVSTLEQQISKEVSGLVVVGFDPALAPSINKAVKAGIPTVTVDADVPNSDRLSFIGTGNRQAGRLGGNALLRLMGSQKGDVLIVTKTGQSNLEERILGYRDVLEKAGIKPRIANDNSDPTKAASAVSSALRTMPNLKGIACVEAAGGTGTATALKEAGKTGAIKVVSMDRDKETLAAIKAGAIQASVAQNSALMTFLAVELLHQYQTVTIPITKDNKAANVTGLPATVDTGTSLVTTENVDAWMR